MGIVKIGDDGTHCPKLILNYLEPGDYHPAKGTSSTYSRTLSKLFANIHKVVQIGFQTNFTPAHKSYIRCTPHFELAEYQHEVVKRCPNHSEPHLVNGNHILTVHSAGPRRDFPVFYVNDHYGRPVVHIQYLDQAEHCRGEECIIRFKFHCLSSCSSMIARRKMCLLFEVVHDDGYVVCSRTMSVVVSTCPGRDMLRQERNATSNLSDAMMEVMGEGAEEEDGDDGVFMVEVDDPRAREMLRVFMAGLERNN